MAKKIKVHIATSLRQVEEMKREGKEPIVFKTNPDEVCVFARSEKVAKVLWHDGSWHLSEPQAGGYQKFTYACPDEQQIVTMLSEQTD